MKKIVGLDIGTNSIGWSVVEMEEFGKEGRILALGSRIIPMDGDALQKFESGNTVSKNADRRQHRMSRRLKQRFVLRRTRMLTVFKIMGWIPDSFPIDFKGAQKNDPGFKFHINDFLPFEQASKEDAYKAFGSPSIPEDWIVYYLRHKALTEKLSISELMRIIYMMNQRRGFKSSRKDKTIQDESDEVKYPIYEKWVQILQIKDIRELSEEKGITTFEVSTGDFKGQIKRRTAPDWKGKELELEITRKTTKSGEISYTFAKPDPSEWEKQKTALNADIRESISSGACRTVGEYLFLHLRDNKNYRIRQRIVDRDLYQAEFKAIWDRQKEFHSTLTDPSRLPEIAKTLYRHNEAKQKEIVNHDLYHLLANDIIYYQRSLKSQKHSIDFCPYEKKISAKGETFGIRVAPRSSPEFQEFRIWQTIHNLRILQLEGDVDGKFQIDIDVSQDILTPIQKAVLFRLFDSRKEVTHAAILKELELSSKSYRLNYSPERSFPGNETKEIFRKAFRKNKWQEGEALLSNKEKFTQLWQILYSLTEPAHIKTALKRLSQSHQMPEEVIESLANLPSLPMQYAAYSSKALKKFISLMRCGPYHNPDAIDINLIDRIGKIIDAEYDENISDELRDRLQQLNLKNITDFQGLPVWVTAYVIYGRHSEKEAVEKYPSPQEIDVPRLIPNNSLRNPVVEQVTKETLTLVKTIWQQHGRPDEIHIELARDLKKTAQERKRLSDIQFANENDRNRIRSILRELKNANPESGADIDRLRLWEETGNETASDSVIRFSKEPTKAEIEKYKLWGEQNHLSPYTGKAIPLSDLFTAKYEIDHIIPRSRYFDDSFANKTICEAAVNKFKDHRTAREMIESDGGRTITDKGVTFILLRPGDYIDHCKRIFRGRKLSNLLRENVPKDFIERQINDTRYISRLLAQLLQPISQNGVVFTIGAISSELKDKWGLNRVWKEILRPRFERLQEITGESLIELDQERNDIHFKKEYKRVDHRHHALDALIIACTTREHVRYLNTLNSATEKLKYQYLVKKKYSDFILPWETFTKEARENLNGVVISHKINKRIVTKGRNKFLKWVQKEDGSWQKEPQKQKSEKLTSIRRSMFKEPLGKIVLREYKTVPIRQALEIQYQALQNPQKVMVSQIADKKIRDQINRIIKNCQFDLKEADKFVKKNPITAKVPVTVFKEYAAKRVALDNSFTHDKIDKIPNASHSWLATLLHDHLRSFDDKPELAFRGEGLDKVLNKTGQKINKVTIFEDIGKKLSFKGKLVESDKGSNLFFVIYEDLKTGKREIDDNSSISLLEAIERLTNKIPVADDRPGYKSIVLSPNDLVYVPEEGENVRMIDWSNASQIQNRVYKVISFTRYQCFFIPHYIARPLDEKGNELGSNNKSERAWNGAMIKNVCIKIKVDILGKVIEADGRRLTTPIVADSMGGQ